MAVAIGRFGVWAGSPSWTPELAKEIESLGFDTIWPGSSPPDLVLAEGLLDVAAAGATKGEWLERWLASRVSLRVSTRRGYAAHVHSCLIPYLGGVPLAALSPRAAGLGSGLVRAGRAAASSREPRRTRRASHSRRKPRTHSAASARLATAHPARQIPRSGDGTRAGTSRSNLSRQG